MEGQLNEAERDVLVKAVLGGGHRVENVVEVGTWLGGGSTLHFLRSLETQGTGRLWGIEADQSIYDKMLHNLTAGAPTAVKRFTPILGFSDEVIPKLLEAEGPQFKVDLVFLDGGNNPNEQIAEFDLLDPVIPVGGRLLSHDAKLRKGKWLVPYVSALDNWSSELLDISPQGLFTARKVQPSPSRESLQRAKRILRKLRLEPKEIAAAILPASVCGRILGMLPKQVADRLANGI